jgi:hypothetical protein
VWCPSRDEPDPAGDRAALARGDAGPRVDRHAVSEPAPRGEALPRALDLKNDANLTLVDWIFRGMVFGLLGVWGFSGLVVLFFLLYSPVYLVNKIPHLVGKGGWLDKREVRFYLACFALVVLLLALFTHSLDAAAILFVVLAGFGPLVWRLLV